MQMQLTNGNGTCHTEKDSFYREHELDLEGKRVNLIFLLRLLTYISLCQIIQCLPIWIVISLNPNILKTVY